MKLTWSYTREVGGCGNYTDAKKCSSDGDDFNNLVVSAVVNARKKSSGNPKDDSDLENKP